LLVQNIFSAKLVNFSKGDFFSFFFQSYPLCQVCLTALICMHYCLSIFTPLLSFSLSVFLFYLSTIMQSTSMARFCVFARRGLTIFLFSSSYSTQYSPPPHTHTGLCCSSSSSAGPFHSHALSKEWVVGYFF
jgi:hypothetical protein